MMAPRGWRGQPLAMIGVVMGLWLGIRALLWQSPFPAPAELVDRLFAEAGSSVPSRGAEARTRIVGIAQPVVLSLPRTRHVEPVAAMRDSPAATSVWQGTGQDVQLMATHQMLLLAAFRQIPIPTEVAQLINRSAARGTEAQAAAPEARIDRWSMDGWLFLRQGGRGLTTQGAFPSSYGASQAGAVLRYRLDPGSDHRPTAFVRLTTAIQSGDEAEAAAGLAVRPLPRIPVAVQAELRARRVLGATRVRPAALAISEFPPVGLPGGLRGEAYAQAGYVGGDFATPFADGQARVTRELATFDLGRVNAGAGVWGGAQKGAARIDAGPTASLDLRLGETPARLAVDYRVRVAGDASPGSGVAVTLSSGF